MYYSIVSVMSKPTTDFQKEFILYFVITEAVTIVQKKSNRNETYTHWSNKERSSLENTPLKMVMQPQLESLRVRKNP